ncbi:YesL family protein [Aquibacillus albus]|uniref:Membrane protein YesL n=1 Tax=Aquibacillus albus TaxID=1168171 RepID=A0ABS2N034_9BACI|nr:DUF624 domain-containing protein [Aquibacillus albus]MBM7571260.1 putative membrane protein YesL [Aquibacillus albus]
MNLGGISGVLYNFCVWFTRFAVLNILWFIFTVLGLVIAGFFPATVALLATTRQFINKNDPPIFKTFWHYYKKEFITSNKLGLILILAGILCYTHFAISSSLVDEIAKPFIYTSYILNSALLLISCHTLASFVEYDQSTKQHIKNGLLIFIYSPFSNLVIIFGILTVYFISNMISGISFFFSAILIALAILSSSHFSYKRLEKKKEKHLQKYTTSVKQMNTIE